MQTLPSFGHIIPLGAVAFLVYFWGIKEQASFPSEKMNITKILGIILISSVAIYAFYYGGLFFGGIYLIGSLIITKTLKNF